MGLARLGVAKLIIIDYDVVDASNLNRQMLFGKEDVGKWKSEIVKKRILDHHRINEKMEIDEYNWCALKNWGKIVEFAG